MLPASRQPPASLSWQWCTMLAEDALNPPSKVSEHWRNPQNPEVPGAGRRCSGQVPSTDCWGHGRERTRTSLSSLTSRMGGGNGHRSNSEAELHIQHQDKQPPTPFLCWKQPHHRGRAWVPSSPSMVIVLFLKSPPSDPFHSSPPSPNMQRLRKQDRSSSQHRPPTYLPLGHGSSLRMLPDPASSGE